MRSMAHPDYVYTPWSEERRDRVARRMAVVKGSPEGFCRVYGVTVPFEHGKVVRFWAAWIKDNHGKAAAVEFVRSLKAKNWNDVPRFTQFWHQRLEITANSKLLRALNREIYRVD